MPVFVCLILFLGDLCLYNAALYAFHLAAESAAMGTTGVKGPTLMWYQGAILDG